MKKCIVIPDSFKGTMTSIEVCNIISEEIKGRFPGCQIFRIPIADGGEGTVDCFIHAFQGKKRRVLVKGPFGEPVDSFYGVFGETAVIEMAAAAGLPLAYGKLNPLKASTYGVGQLIGHAVTSGCREIILGLGGSCTNDAGAGMAAALGTVFLNEKGIGFIPTGDTLEKVSQIDNRGTERFLKGVEIKAMCDINNPMYGKKGAAYIFGPQKGAGPREVQVLDRNLRTFSRTIESALGRDVSSLPGSGAAGAMGAGVSVFLGGSLVSGIDLLLDTVNFDELLEGCDAVFTGEGKLDSQSFGGKVIAGVAKHARTRRIPVFIIAGSMEPNLNRQLHKWGVCKAAPVYEAAPNIEAILATCRQDLSKKAAELCQEMADSGF